MKYIVLIINLLFSISLFYSQSNFKLLFIVNNNINDDSEIFNTHLNLVKSPEFKKVKFSEIKIMHYTHGKFVNKEDQLSKKCQFLYRSITNTCGNFSSEKFTTIINSLSGEIVTVNWGSIPKKLTEVPFDRNFLKDSKLIEGILAEYKNCKKEKNTKTIVIYSENIKNQQFNISFDNDYVLFNIGQNITTPTPVISPFVSGLNYKWSSEPDMKIKDVSSKSTEILSPQEGILKLEVSDACSTAYSQITLKSKFSHCDCENSEPITSPIIRDHDLIKNNPAFFDQQRIDQQGKNYINLITREKGNFKYIIYLDKSVCGDKFQLEIFDTETEIRIMDPFIRKRSELTDQQTNDPLTTDYLGFHFAATPYMGRDPKNKNKLYYIVITPYDENNKLCKELSFKTESLLFSPCD
jgi:hypothetical protein